MALLFQPRRAVTVRTPPEQDVPPKGEPPVDRPTVFRAALEAVVRGDGSRFQELFTDDVTFASPHLRVATRAAMQAVVGVPEDSLSDITIEVRPLGAVGDTVMAEWWLDATFSGPLLFDDDVLIEPTGGPVRLHGASVAEFRGASICSFRHYFDDSELVGQIPGVPSQVRWGLGPTTPGW